MWAHRAQRWWQRARGSEGQGAGAARPSPPKRRTHPGRLGRRIDYLPGHPAWRAAQGRGLLCTWEAGGGTAAVASVHWRVGGGTAAVGDVGRRAHLLGAAARERLPLEMPGRLPPTEGSAGAGRAASVCRSCPPPPCAPLRGTRVFLGAPGSGLRGRAEPLLSLQPRLPAPGCPLLARFRQAEGAQKVCRARWQSGSGVIEQQVSIHSGRRRSASASTADEWPRADVEHACTCPTGTCIS